MRSQSVERAVDAYLSVPSDVSVDELLKRLSEHVAARFSTKEAGVCDLIASVISHPRYVWEQHGDSLINNCREVHDSSDAFGTFAAIAMLLVGYPYMVSSARHRLTFWIMDYSRDTRSMNALVLLSLMAENVKEVDKSVEQAIEVVRQDLGV